MAPPPCPERVPVTMIQRSSSLCPPLQAGPWASLPDDLVRLIGWRVLAGDLLDYVRFRAACARWSSSTTSPRGRGVLDPRFHPRRWAALPEGHGLWPGHPGLGGHVRFFSLSTGALVRARLPLLDDHAVLESVDGLLLLCRRRDTATRLLHPFTGDIAELPPLSTLCPQMDSHYSYMEKGSTDKLREFLIRGICAALTVGASGAITVMLALDVIERVIHATAGDQGWTLSAWALPASMTRPAAFHGRLYVASGN